VVIFGGILLAACLATSPAATARSAAGIHFRNVTVGKSNYRYEIYVPSDWTPSKKWPVILFLHGIGHRGQYPLGKTESVLARLFLGYQKSPEAVIVFPRCPADATWIEPRMEELALKALSQSLREFNGDPNRVYLTGLSMGGYGTWYLASRHPGKFAAIAPICGGIRAQPLIPLPAVLTGDNPYADVARKIAPTPVWIFHGAADDVIDVTESRRMAEAIKAAGGEMHYTEYPNVGHDSWNKAYAEPEFINWLLSKTLSGRGVETK
jgi:predicted peptidase